MTGTAPRPPGPHGPLHPPGRQRSPLRTWARPLTRPRPQPLVPRPPQAHRTPPAVPAPARRGPQPVRPAAASPAAAGAPTASGASAVPGASASRTSAGDSSPRLPSRSSAAGRRQRSIGSWRGSRLRRSSVRSGHRRRSGHLSRLRPDRAGHDEEKADRQRPERGRAQRTGLGERDAPEEARERRAAQPVSVGWVRCRKSCAAARRAPMRPPARGSGGPPRGWRIPDTQETSSAASRSCSGVERVAARELRRRAARRASRGQHAETAWARVRACRSHDAPSHGRVPCRRPSSSRSAMPAAVDARLHGAHADRSSARRSRRSRSPRTSKRMMAVRWSSRDALHRTRERGLAVPRDRRAAPGLRAGSAGGCQASSSHSG